MRRIRVVTLGALVVGVLAAGAGVAAPAQADPVPPVVPIVVTLVHAVCLAAPEYCNL